MTGNTGFKGSWLTKILLNAGADVMGYALKPATKLNLFTIADLESASRLSQIYGDVRDLEALKKSVAQFKPDIVLHLAAQPIVRESYRNPVYTYEANVMGTVNVCECVRLSHFPVLEGGIGSAGWGGVKSFVNVTTDKVYKNFEWEYGYREGDPLDGYDPYSNSKSCSELVTHSYRDSFFRHLGIAVSTARAGNVIGGGDFANDRIIPDCVRAVYRAKVQGLKSAQIGVRNPYATRPYQHVLEPLSMYLAIARSQYEDNNFAGYYNIGPDDSDCVTTGNLVSLFCDQWNHGVETIKMPEAAWVDKAEENAPHEASFLKLDCSRVKSVFGWRPRWHIDKAMAETVAWTKAWMDHPEDAEVMKAEMDREIEAYFD